jgi:hypothetical protein
VNASTLHPEWNQMFAVAYDTAGNASENAYIWLYKLVQGQAAIRIYLPSVAR